MRGLDYYVRTTFEVKTTELGAQNAVAGGGRYDGLIEQLDGPADPGIGFAIGLERGGAAPGEEEAAGAPLVLLIPLGEAALQRLLPVARQARAGRGGASSWAMARASCPASSSAPTGWASAGRVIAGDNELAPE